MSKVIRNISNWEEELGYDEIMQSNLEKRSAEREMVKRMATVQKDYECTVDIQPMTESSSEHIDIEEPNTRQIDVLEYEYNSNTGQIE